MLDEAGYTKEGRVGVTQPRRVVSASHDTVGTQQILKMAPCPADQVLACMTGGIDCGAAGGSGDGLRSGTGCWVLC
jgi:hypothetical protein